MEDYRIERRETRAIRHSEQSRDEVRDVRAKGQDMGHLQKTADDNRVDLRRSTQFGSDSVREVFRNFVERRDADHMKILIGCVCRKLVRGLGQESISGFQVGLMVDKSGPIRISEFRLEVDDQLVGLQAPLHVPRHAWEVQSSPDVFDPPARHPEQLFNRGEVMPGIAEVGERHGLFARRQRFQCIERTQKAQRTAEIKADAVCHFDKRVPDGRIRLGQFTDLARAGHKVIDRGWQAVGHPMLGRKSEFTELSEEIKGQFRFCD